MNLKHWTLLGLGTLFLVACPKKPPPIPPEPKPPRVEEPAPVPQPEPPKVDEEALRRQRIQAKIASTFRPIYFEYDQSTLSPEAKATLTDIGALMKEEKDITARVEGHADERGTNEYNLSLGERRSKAVQDYLASYGVNATRLSTISYGEEKPAMEGHDEASWSKNRRVEFTTTF